MTYREALEYFDSFINYEKSPSYDYRNSVKLERMEGLLEKLGNPHLDVERTIHIAGTKGKGSTAAFTQSILKEGGYEVGLYTSPHLISMRERIRVGDELISADDIGRLAERLRGLTDRLPKESRPTFFELYTALAFLYFKEKRVDFAIYEVGMGGRLDATNVIRPLVSAITPISYDHTKSLGNSLKEIASEKADIIKNDSICIVSPQEEEAYASIESVARSRRASLYRVGRDILFEILPSFDEKEIFNVYGVFSEYPLCETTLLGGHQVSNAATAIGITEALRSFGITVPQPTVRQGVAKTSWPGRLEIISRNPTIVLDCAHNRASASALASTMVRKFKAKGIILILGISKDKDIEGIVNELEPIARCIILTKSNAGERAESPAKIRCFIREKDSILTENLQDAIKEAMARASPDYIILITGSIFLVGEAKSILQPNGDRHLFYWIRDSPLRGQSLTMKK